QNLKLVLTLCSERELGVKEADRKLLTVMLSLASISLENLMLYEEARATMAELENVQNHMIGLERAATQGLMSAEIAHELNNFLTIITSNIELFEMKVGDNLPESGTKHLEKVKTHLQNVEKFTASLSDAGKMESKRADCGLNELISEIVSFTAHQKRFRHIEVSTDLDAKLPIQNLDPAQMQQFLYNMLNNAADAIGLEREDGRITIVTKTNPEMQNFTLVIRDNGCGFSPENRSKAFKDRFTTKDKGHGFGLMVSRRIIDNHDGRLDIESAPGQGTTIRVTFPYFESKATTQQPAETVAAL
ncbi:MAG: ATP-binding protein, partial [bacterium]